jgi:hypothetical protein
MTIRPMPCVSANARMVSAGLPISTTTLICTPCHSGRAGNGRQIPKRLLLLKVPLLIQAYFLKANCDHLLNRRNNLKECYFRVGQL